MPPSQRRLTGVIVALTMVVLAGGYITWRLHVMGRRGWTGISYVAVFGDRESQKSIPMVAFKPGSIIMVYPDSPADRQGVRIGDRVVAVNGTPIEKTTEMGTVADAAKFGDVLTYRI